MINGRNIHANTNIEAVYKQVAILVTEDRNTLRLEYFSQAGFFSRQIPISSFLVL